MIPAIRRSTLRLAASLCLPAGLAIGADPDRRAPFDPGETIALVGGADAAASDAFGYLEAALASGFPDLDLRFRNLAREGDTVYQQPRDHAFPSLRDQLEAVGATSLLVWFGRAEALDDPAAPDAFAVAYRALLDSLAPAVGRVILITPVPFEAPASPLAPDLASRNGILGGYADAIRELGRARGHLTIDLFGKLATMGNPPVTTNGLQVGEGGQRAIAEIVGRALGAELPAENGEALRQAVIEKNRLWFHFSRPQNWAFLGGDRTSQPSSRDHLDPEHRWFPEEMRAYLPLIDAADRKIHELAKLPPVKP